MDRIFNKNYENRYCKSTQSPGISQIFGGATQNTDKEVKFSGKVNQQIVGNMNASPNKEVRYNDTYKSNIFDNNGSSSSSFKYDTPVKTGGALNTVGRGMSSGKNSETSSNYRGSA